MVENVRRKNHGHLKKWQQYKTILKLILRVMLFPEKTWWKMRKKNFQFCKNELGFFFLIKARVYNLIVNNRKKK